MTKNDLVAKIAESSGIARSTAEKALNCLVSACYDALA